jgi:hypothetical protein
MSPSSSALPNKDHEIADEVAPSSWDQQGLCSMTASSWALSWMLVIFMTSANPSRICYRQGDSDIVLENLFDDLEVGVEKHRYPAVGDLRRMDHQPSNIGH